ncbi:nectin-3-like protein precursor [Silurus asotus]|uniref:Nectin-3-like protein n=1 Tax=Silurus asotus TaxID=30991 RepID=A0AAD5FHP7_SILAS|nr:nectin-3-like protein precursor [Silurus asotus]
MRRGQEKELLFFCLIYIIYIKGCLAGDDIITSGPVRAKLGQSVSLSCRIKDETHMSVSVWRFCNDSTTIAVFKPGEQNSTHIEEQYTSRVSITQYHTLTILQVQDRDYGDYCCTVAAFPQGSLEGRIQLLKQNDNEGVSHPPAVGKFLSYPNPKK